MSAQIHDPLSFRPVAGAVLAAVIAGVILHQLTGSPSPVSTPPSSSLTDTPMIDRLTLTATPLRPQASAQQAVEYYTYLLTSDRVDDAWSMLTPEFQESKHVGGHDGFKWWILSKIAEVEFGDVTEATDCNLTCSLYVGLAQYHWLDDNITTYRNSIIELSRRSEDDPWKISSITNGPSDE